MRSKVITCCITDLNITLGTETQINPFGRKDETGREGSSASMGTVSPTCEERFNDLDIQNLLLGDMIAA